MPPPRNQTQPRRSASSLFCTVPAVHFFTSQRFTLFPDCLYQKDERALPGNLQSGKRLWLLTAFHASMAQAVSRWRPGFSPRLVVGFVVDKEALCQFSVRVFPISLSFHQCSIMIRRTLGRSSARIRRRDRWRGKNVHVRYEAVQWGTAARVRNVGGAAGMQHIPVWTWGSTEGSLTTRGVEPRCSHRQDRSYSLFTGRDVKGLRLAEKMNAVVYS